MSNILFLNEIKRSFKNYLNAAYFIVLPIVWFLGTETIRYNIAFLKNGVNSALSNSGISQSVIEAAEAQLNAQNGFMVFMEGVSEFYVSVAVALIVGLTCSSAFAYDKNTCFGNSIITREKFKKYFIYKAVSTFAVPFIMIFTVLTLVFIAALIIYSPTKPTQAFNFSMNTESSFTVMFFEHYWFSCFFMIFTLSLFGGLYALLGMGIGFATSNRFIISISPFAIYILCTLIPQFFSLKSPVSKYLAWIFPSYFTGVFIGNDYWYTELPKTVAYFVHISVLAVPAVTLLYLLYRKNYKQYIK